METFYPKKSPKFLCEYCDYSTSSSKDYNKHLLTKKHKTLVEETCFHYPEIAKPYECNICLKTYSNRTGLWKHKQKCKLHDNEQIVQSNQQQAFSDKDLITMLINDNKELRNLIIEQSKETGEFKNIILEQQNMMMKVIETGTHTTNNNINANTTHTNSHNKAFNLNFFLNETCKNAMNLTDFVESIKLQLTDLERIGELGYTQGISDIITSNLKAMDVTLRPVHCTDKKRETVYIRDNNEWKKEEDSKPSLRKAIKKVEDRNIRLLPLYRATYPDCNKSTSRMVDKYDKIVLEAMGGVGDGNAKLEKIIRNISNVTTIDK